MAKNIRLLQRKYIINSVNTPLSITKVSKRVKPIGEIIRDTIQNIIFIVLSEYSCVTVVLFRFNLSQRYINNHFLIYIAIKTVP